MNRRAKKRRLMTARHHQRTQADQLARALAASEALAKSMKKGQKQIAAEMNKRGYTRIEVSRIVTDADGKDRIETEIKWRRTLWGDKPTRKEAISREVHPIPPPSATVAEATMPLLGEMIRRRSR